jgi:hypothetical protein
MNAPLPEFAAPFAPLEGQLWIDANEEVVRLGLAWIDRRLAGEGGQEERADYLFARDRMRDAGSAAAIDRIGTVFGLSPFEEDILLIALAPAIDGAFGPRYGAAQGRLMAAPASAHLIAKLVFGAERLPPAAMERLSRQGLLRRYALLAVDETVELVVSAGLLAPERVREVLCGLNDPETALQGLARRLVTPPLPMRLRSLAATVARSADHRLRLQIIGAPGSGRAVLAAAIMERLGCAALVVSVVAQTEGYAAILAREAVLGGAGIVLEAGETTDGVQAAARALARLLPGPLVVVAATPVEGLEDVPVLRFEPLDADERAELWRSAGTGLDEDAILMAAEQFALGPAQIEAVARQPGIAGRSLWAACRDLGARDLEALSTRVVPRRSWDDIVLAPETRAELEALAAQITGRPQVNGGWGYRKIVGRATGVSALFAGPSGVGKTMAAEVIAGALQLDLHVVDLARVTSKYIGETEKNLRRIFDAAEAGGVVLFFDEAEALFGKRSEIKDSHDRYANAEISYLLQRMETYGGLAILATNLKSHVDTAFLRRLRMIVDFPMPDVPARLALWKRALPKSAPQEGIDWQNLARLDLSGGNITTIAVNAAFRAAAEGAPIGMRHLRGALDAEFRKLDRDASALKGGA